MVKNFSVSAKILSIHSISIAFVFIGGYLSRLYIGCGYAKKNFRRTFFSLIINVALVYYMIPHFGISGAAYAMVISQIFSSFIMFIIDKEFMSRLAKGKNMSLLITFLLVLHLLLCFFKIKSDIEESKIWVNNGLFFEYYLFYYYTSFFIMCLTEN
ncbi:polysaccharide biosynthesis C-terminal domain-containing protein [Klebsiella quasipneumoniae]